MDSLIFPDIIKSHVTAFFTGKDPGADLDNVSRMLKIKKENIFIPIQKHTDKIVLIEASPEPMIADAVITKEEGLLIGIQVADCVPILLYEKANGILGAVHAGWRGTAEGILKKTINTIIDRFRSNPENFLLAMGPSIRWCCYKVDYNVLNAVKQATGKGKYNISRHNGYYLDLAMANKYQALSMGIPEANIWISDECTSCCPDKYYSYRYAKGTISRYAKGTSGRQGGFIGKLSVIP